MNASEEKTTENKDSVLVYETIAIKQPLSEYDYAYLDKLYSDYSNIFLSIK